MQNRTGKVWLVGAGPGDPELLTLKAVRALASADVILIDDLVDRAVLTHARQEVRVIGVGKRGGCRSTSQTFINHLLLREARSGNVVVRLKGGDPFVFGRGGEEAAALRAAGIEVETVNGITAGLAAPAAAGIAVTQRGVAQGVALITGHAAADGDKKGEEPNWAALARSGLDARDLYGPGACSRHPGQIAGSGDARIDAGGRHWQRHVCRRTVRDLYTPRFRRSCCGRRTSRARDHCHRRSCCIFVCHDGLGRAAAVRDVFGRLESGTGAENTLVSATERRG